MCCITLRCNIGGILSELIRLVAVERWDIAVAQNSKMDIYKQSKEKKQSNIFAMYTFYTVRYMKNWS